MIDILNVLPVVVVTVPLTRDVKCVPLGRMIGFLDTDENEYYFLFIVFVSYVRVFTYVRGLVTPTGQGFPCPLFSRRSDRLRT